MGDGSVEDECSRIDLTWILILTAASSLRHKCMCFGVHAHVFPCCTAPDLYSLPIKPCANRRIWVASATQFRVLGWTRTCVHASLCILNVVLPCLHREAG